MTPPHLCRITGESKYHFPVFGPIQQGYSLIHMHTFAAEIGTQKVCVCVLPQGVLWQCETMKQMKWFPIFRILSIYGGFSRFILFLTFRFGEPPGFGFRQSVAQTDHGCFSATTFTLEIAMLSSTEKKHLSIIYFWGDLHRPPHCDTSEKYHTSHLYHDNLAKVCLLPVGFHVYWNIFLMQPICITTRLLIFAILLSGYSTRKGSRGRGGCWTWGGGWTNVFQYRVPSWIHLQRRASNTCRRHVSVPAFSEHISQCCYMVRQTLRWALDVQANKNLMEGFAHSCCLVFDTRRQVISRMSWPLPCTRGLPFISPTYKNYWSVVRTQFSTNSNPRMRKHKSITHSNDLRSQLLLSGFYSSECFYFRQEASITWCDLFRPKFGQKMPQKLSLYMTSSNL